MVEYRAYVQGLGAAAVCWISLTLTAGDTPSIKCMDRLSKRDKTATE